jgi:hypothetical protein
MRVKPILIDLDPAMGTGGKDLTIHPERLSESDPGNRDMRQSELLGMSNQERRGRRTPPASNGVTGLKSNSLAPANEIEFFQRPIGQNTAAGVLKTLLHTNMRESCAL